MGERSLSEFIQAVAAELARDNVEVASQWVTGSIETQEARAPHSGSVADLVLSSQESGPVVVEFRRAVRSSLDVASITRHMQVVREQTPGAKYALVSLDPVPNTARSVLAERNVRFIEGEDVRAVAHSLEALVGEPAGSLAQ